MFNRIFLDKLIFDKKLSTRGKNYEYKKSEHLFYESGLKWLNRGVRKRAGPANRLSSVGDLALWQLVKFVFRKIAPGHFNITIEHNFRTYLRYDIVKVRHEVQTISRISSPWFFEAQISGTFFIVDYEFDLQSLNRIGNKIQILRHCRYDKNSPKRFSLPIGLKIFRRGDLNKLIQNKCEKYLFFLIWHFRFLNVTKWSYW